MTRSVVVVALLALVAQPVRGADQPGKVTEVAIVQRLDNQVPPELSFRDENGRDVTLGDYFGGKPIVLVLAYYRCPRLCTLVLNKLVESLRQLDYEVGKEFAVVVVSIDARERPELAAAKKESCVEAYGRPRSAAGWHFLTGDEPAIRRLADEVGFRYFYDPEKDLFAHASGVMVLTPGGKIARYFYGLDYPSRDLRFGLEDAAARRIGSPVTEPLRLLCFDYDPLTGRYTLQVMRLVRAAGVLTVAVLALFLWRHWRRERRALRGPVTEVGS